MRIEAAIIRDSKELEPDEPRQSYDKQALKIYHDYEEIVFNLSEQSANETIESVKRMSLGQRLKFQKLIQARNLKNRNTQKNAK